MNAGSLQTPGERHKTPAGLEEFAFEAAGGGQPEGDAGHAGQDSRPAAGKVRVAVPRRTGVASHDTPETILMSPGGATPERARSERLSDSDTKFGQRALNNRLVTPEKLAGYRLIEKIGKGGMGVIFKARQISLDRVVAVKILSDRLAANQEFVERFEQEARSAARLSHPNIVGAVDVGNDAGTYYFAMEYIDGKSVRRMLEESGRLPTDTAIDIIIQIATGLEYAWRNSIIHRDIKPDNIMVTREGVAKLADLGLAREAGAGRDSRLTQVGFVVGTPSYVSLEQARGQQDVDIRGDIYSLGVTFYHMVTGQIPFKGESFIDVMQARFEGPVTPANEVCSDVTPGLGQVINVMMALDRDDRHPDPSVLLHDLMLVAQGLKPEFASPDKAARARAIAAAKDGRRTTTFVKGHRGQSWKVPVILGIMVGIAAVGGGAALLHLALRTPPRPPAVAVAVPARVAAATERRARIAGELDVEAANVYRALSRKVEAGDVEAALDGLTALGLKYVETEHHATLEALKFRALRKVEEATRLAAVSAERGRRHRELVRVGREEIAAGDYAMAITMLTQARAIQETGEVRTLLEGARRGRHLARAKEAEDSGQIGKAVELYGLARAIRDEPELAARVTELTRRRDVAERVATGDRLAAQARWLESKGAYREALDLARDGERSGIEARIRAADRELNYTRAMEGARAALEKKRWKEALAGAESALAIKPGDEAAHEIVARARDALGPEPEVTNSIGVEFVLIPAGEFAMGSDEGDTDERPVHTVHLDAYYIGRHEVTNAQFERYRPGHRNKWKQFSPGDDMPAIAVSWDDAAAFCRWLSEREGVEYRLPTEAEWEKAARGTDARVYPWGNGPPFDGRTYKANFAVGRSRHLWKRDGFELAAPVGSFPAGASPCGVHDMAGNVWEWCFDWYHRSWYSVAPQTNPTGPRSGTKRVLRGGALNDEAPSLRCANRLAKPPDFYEANIGFRCVRAVRSGAPGHGIQ